MTMGHPARDLWYLLQIGTDADFRSKHLDSVLEEYYAVFNTYLNASGVKVEFTDFRAECEKWRAPMSLLFGSFVIFLSLNPEPQSMNSWNGFKKIMRDMEEKLGCEEMTHWLMKDTTDHLMAKDTTDSPMMKDTDHLMMKEIRRRITEGVFELDALGLFG